MKGELGCNLVKDENIRDKLLESMTSSLEKNGWKVGEIDRISEGQPFRLRLMQALLQQLGDSDHKFLLDGEVGFRLEYSTHCRGLRTCMRSWRKIHT